LSHHYGDQCWAIDPHIIKFIFYLTAVNELYQPDEQIEKII